MYDSQTSLIANYINPIIGDMEVQSITPRVVDKYIQTLQKTPCVVTKTHIAKNKYVSNYTIEKVIKLLRCAFKQAVRWELIGRNPFDGAVIPKAEHQKHDIWDADTIRLALDKCTDSKLYILIHQAAKKYFDSLGADQPLSVKALREEYAKLLSRKRKAYAAYKQAREEMKELYNVKSNVEHLLNIDEREIERDREKEQR